jgi:hypothetical protein
LTGGSLVGLGSARQRRLFAGCIDGSGVPRFHENQ